MNSFRNNEVKFNQSRLTDAEVLNILGHTAVRVTTVLGEMANMVDIAQQRGLVEVDLANFGEMPQVGGDAA